MQESWLLEKLHYLCCCFREGRHFKASGNFNLWGSLVLSFMYRVRNSILNHDEGKLTVIRRRVSLLIPTTIHKVYPFREKLTKVFLCQLPCTYKKHSDRPRWSDDSFIPALNIVRKEWPYCNSAAEASLRRDISFEFGSSHSLWTLSNYFHRTTKYLKDLNQKAIGLISSECKKLEIEFSESYPISHCIN